MSLQYSTCFKLPAVTLLLLCRDLYLAKVYNLIESLEQILTTVSYMDDQD